MRVFIAIELPPSLKLQIINSTRNLHSHLKGKWVETNNLHLTLAFVGEIDSQKLPAIYRAVKQAAEGCGPIDLTIGQPIAIPATKPRLVALRVSSVSPNYNRLQQKIVKFLKKLNLSPQAHKAHLTLVRLKQFPRLWHNLTLKPLNISLQTKEISLIQSTLTPQGPIYKRLKAINLTSGAAYGQLRPNVAICVINPQNEVLLVKHREHIKNYWQFPQGGIKAGDSLPVTVQRELWEELGLKDFKLLGIYEKIYQYHWPAKLIRAGQDPEKRSYIGQEQSLAIVKVKESRPKLMPDPREAAEVRWFPINQVIRALNPIRRRLGRLVMIELKKLIFKKH